MKKPHYLLLLIAFLTIFWQGYEQLGFNSKKISIQQDVVPKTKKLYSSNLDGGKYQDINTLLQKFLNLDRRIASIETQIQKIVNFQVEVGQEQEVLESTVDFSEEDRVEQEKEDEIVNKEHIDQLEIDFLTEKQDKSWTQDTTDRLYQSIESNELLGTSLVDLECRSTLCRIEVDHKNFKDQDSFDLNFTVDMPNVFSKFTISRTEDEDGNGGSSTIVYAFRVQD